MGVSPTTPANVTRLSGITRQFPIPPCALDVDDLERLFRLLEKKASEAAEEQANSLKQLEGQTDEQFREARASLRNLLDLVVRVQGVEGEWTLANATDPIDEESLPVSVSSIQYDSFFRFRVRFNNAQPLNHFLVTLDFRRTDIFDLTNTVIAAQTNPNSVSISGSDITWVNAVTQELRAFFKQRATNRGWLYSRFAYDFLLLFIGIPASLNLVYHADKVVGPILRLPEALFVALYVYLVLILLLVFRFLFNYVKWVFPRVDGPVKRRGIPGVHKTVLAAIGLALLTRAVTSILWLFGLHLH